MDTTLKNMLRSHILNSLKEVIKLPVEFPHKFHNKSRLCTYYFERIDLAATPSYDMIIPGLYLGNARTATDGSLLRQLEITHVLTIQGKRLSRTVVNFANVDTLFIKVKDHPKTNLKKYFPLSNKFIDDGVRYGKVLVHCHLGVSRSATLVIAYLMEKQNMSFNDAFELVKTKRPFINPNSGFLRQLQDYEDSRHHVNCCERRKAYLIVTLRKHKCKMCFAMAFILLGVAVLPVVILFI